MYNLVENPESFLMGKGIGEYRGHFGVRAGLPDEFGGERANDAPILEGLLSEGSARAAIAGMKPILEIMNFNFIPLAMDGIVN